MNHTEQITHFAGELDNLIARFAQEYELPYVSILGVMQLKSALLIRDMLEKDDD